MVQLSDTREKTYTDFVTLHQDAIRHALVAAHGIEAGREAAADAFSYGWEHWDRISGMDNPAGYLYRVGQHRARRQRRDLPLFVPPPSADHDPWVEPALPAALEMLTARQRTAVVLIHAYEMTYQEAADLLGVTRSSIQRHLERGLAKLRLQLGVE